MPIAMVLGLAAAVASGATFTVSSSADSGSGSLRQAILDSNASPGPDVISFPATQPQLAIQLASPLPAIDDTVDMRCNPNKVLIDGRKLSAGNGIVILADASVVRGLVLFGFPGNGIEIRDAAKVNVMLNTIGLTSSSLDQVVEIGGSGILLTNATSCEIGGNDVAGAQDGIVLIGGGENVVESNHVGLQVGNRGDGIVVDGSSSNIIGAYPCYVLCPVGGNVISSNRGVGIAVHGDSNTVVGNVVGRSSLAFTSGNGSHGIEMSGVSNRVELNQVVSNRGDGIRVSSGSTAIESNTFNSNAGLPIDLGGDGPTPNDALDLDSGPDGLQNFPLITDVTTNGVSTRFRGTLSSAADSEYLLDFIGAPWCGTAADAPSGSAGQQTWRTNDSGFAQFDIVVDRALTPGGAVAATATGVDGTSEVGPCAVVAGSTETRADLSVRQTPPHSTIVPGQRFAITIDVDNAGPAPSGFVRLKNPPPTGAQIVSVSTTAGECYLGGLNECYLGGLPPGGHVEIELMLVVTTKAGDQIANSARVLNGLGEPDPVAGNNSSTLILDVSLPKRLHPVRK